MAVSREPPIDTNDSNHSNRVIGGKSAHADAMRQSKETNSA